MTGPPAVPYWRALAIPALLAVTGTLEYVFEDLGASPAKSLPYLYLMIGALAVGLRFPFAGPVAALSILTAEAFAVNVHVVVDPVSTLLIALYCMFILAARNDERRAVVGGVAGLSSIAVVATTTPSNPLWVFFVSALLLAVWGFGLVYGRRERHAIDLEVRTERVEADAAAAVSLERARIAREIHDIVSHSVSVIVLQARGGRRALGGDGPDARHAFDSIEAAGEEALVELRRLLGVIRQDGTPPALAPQPGLADLESLVQQVCDAGVPVTVEVTGVPSSLAPGLDLTAYRVVQEGLTNMLKHSRAETATVVVRFCADAVTLEIADNGDGARSKSSRGRGLAGMQERVTLYGGTMQSTDPPEGGHLLRVRLPLAQT
jgi:signal transduction histidine kinase